MWVIDLTVTVREGRARVFGALDDGSDECIVSDIAEPTTRP